jgi:hypothetical protein
MPIFGRKPQAAAPPSMELPSGEEIERSTPATLLQGKNAIKGSLFLTNKRLLFEAKTGDERWMSVPFSEIKSAGLYPWPRATLGAPSSRRQCLAVETKKDEQVWWDFGERDEREWLPIVKHHAEALVMPEDEP